MSDNEARAWLGRDLPGPSLHRGYSLAQLVAWRDSAEPVQATGVKLERVGQYL
jgi:hypothetical protein